MVIFRIIGFLFIIVALMALGADALLSLEKGEVVLRSLAELWGLGHQPSLDWLNERIAAEGTHEKLANAGQAVLAFPAWGVLGIAGIVLAGIGAIFRRRD